MSCILNTSWMLCDQWRAVKVLFWGPGVFVIVCCRSIQIAKYCRYIGILNESVYGSDSRPRKLDTKPRFHQ